jgi:CheY-like chemotaxis protein
MTATRPATSPLLLAVEDEPRNAALLEAILGRAGYRLHVATGVTEAREFLEGDTPTSSCSTGTCPMATGST